MPHFCLLVASIPADSLLLDQSNLTQNPRVAGVIDWAQGRLKVDEGGKLEFRFGLEVISAV